MGYAPVVLFSLQISRVPCSAAAVVKVPRLAPALSCWEMLNAGVYSCRLRCLTPHPPLFGAQVTAVWPFLCLYCMLAVPQGKAQIHIPIFFLTLSTLMLLITQRPIHFLHQFAFLVLHIIHCMKIFSHTTLKWPDYVLNNPSSLASILL